MAERQREGLAGRQARRSRMAVASARPGSGWRAWVGLGCALLGTACGGEDAAPAGGGGACTLEATARELVTDIVHRMAGDAAYVASMSHPGDSAFALTLPGVDQGSLGVATVMFPCTEATWYVPSCSESTQPEPSSPFWTTRDRCMRLGCGGPEVYLVEVYLTERPHDQADDPHPFTYEIASPAGTAVFDPNPSAVWRLDASAGADAFDITASLSRALRWTGAAGGELDLSHVVSVEFGHAAGAVESALLSVAFPVLDPGGTIEVEMSADTAGAVTGDVRQGGRVLGTVTGALPLQVGVSWSADCP